MKITVVGCGRWGSFIAKYLADAGHDITLYGRVGSANMQEFLRERKNQWMTLPESVRLSTELAEACAESDLVLVSIGSQQLRGFFEEYRQTGCEARQFCLCMKGLEISTGKRLSVIAREVLGEHISVAVWLGPGHVQEFCAGIPNCMVIDSDDEELKCRLVDAFSGALIRFYYGRDMIGNEIGAAAKNVIGIAAGLLDGVGLSTLKGALMSRGTREVARLIGALGGNEQSAYGLCHLGDYEATVFSPHSHNRRFGEAFAKGERFDALAEGYYTVKALNLLAAERGVEMPICRVIEDVLYHELPVKEGISRLFKRTLKNEF
ncbi:MAG: NAD(P)H-dependent glycerol-3-phosphate dehydrogenase [Clostridia bacterium]|nr:NAD(P)H-dependent glycerol-3-phosphate dehydrogenase [Clostridia bacterium]